jgi:ferrous iron transport protein A
MKEIDLSQMGSGEQGIVSAIKSGYGLTERAESLGIRIGIEIKKISSQLMHGPVTIQVGNTQVALGFGMAKKIFVKVE